MSDNDYNSDFYESMFLSLFLTLRPILACSLYLLRTGSIWYRAAAACLRLDSDQWDFDCYFSFLS